MATKNNEYPFDYQELSSEDSKLLSEYFLPENSTFVRLGANGYFFYDVFLDTVLEIYNMEVRPSDTYVVTFPRSGTTWTQELVWLIQNNCDFETAKSTVLPKRFPFIESGAFLKLKNSQLADIENLEKYADENLVKDVKSLSTIPSPRFLKSHLPLSLLSPSLLDTAKVVYVARDPRDVAVSFYFHMRSYQVVREDKDFKSFWNFFIKNQSLWCPVFEHVKEAWNQRNHPNLMFIFYEELLEDLPAVARRMATFFNKQYSDEQFQALAEYLKFDNFKNNTSVNMKTWHERGLTDGTFIRKGKSGGWREHFDAEMTSQAETWIADNLRDTDLRFPTMQ